VLKIDGMFWFGLILDFQLKFILYW